MLLSKFIFYTVLLFASLLLTFAIGQAVFDMTSSLTPLAFAFIAAGGFLFLAMGMLLGTIVKDPESASAIANAVGVRVRRLPVDQDTLLRAMKSGAKSVD